MSSVSLSSSSSSSSASRSGLGLELLRDRLGHTPPCRVLGRVSCPLPVDTETMEGIAPTSGPRQGLSGQQGGLPGADPGAPQDSSMPGSGHFPLQLPRTPSNKVRVGPDRSPANPKPDSSPAGQHREHAQGRRRDSTVVLQERVSESLRMCGGWLAAQSCVPTLCALRNPGEPPGLSEAAVRHAQPTCTPSSHTLVCPASSFSSGA